MNAAFKEGLKSIDWIERRNTFWVTDDEKLMRGMYGLSSTEQKLAIQNAGHEPIMSYNQTDFVKDRVAVEVQFDKYAFVAHDLFVKHQSFYVSDIIDVGIEILPMKEMSSGRNATIRTGLHDNFIPEAEELRFVVGLGTNAAHYRIF